jgi:fumarylacetoacetase
MIALSNATHDPTLRSWVDSANAADTDFPIQNLPFAVFRRAGTQEAFRGGIAIGTQILDLGALQRRALCKGPAAEALAAAAAPRLNRLMALSAPVRAQLRETISALLRHGASTAAQLGNDLVAQTDAQFDLPAEIGNYTDFYSSIYHATAVGKLLRPDNPLLPNYRWMPIAYHGRASSIRVSDHSVQRPNGQTLPAGAAAPVFGPSKRLDYELELGVFIGTGNALGTPIPIDRAEQHVFGLCLLNDWSARDIQAWEYQPLGPFLGKNFATTISPWIVTLEALAPFRTAFMRPTQDPPPLTYLDSPSMRGAGAISIELEVYLETAHMRARGLAPQRLSRANFRDAYWAIAQLIAHHTVGGCNLMAGDLLGTGTQSGPTPAEAGSLLELSGGGTRDIPLASGESRRFLEDGDRVILRAWCERPGFARIGFGAASACVLENRAHGLE